MRSFFKWWKKTAKCMVRGDARWIQCWGGNVDSSVTKEEETTGGISLLL